MHRSARYDDSSNMRIRTSWQRTTGVLLAALLSPPSLGAETANDPIEEIGKQEFTQSCAACHGENGKGGGPVAEVLVVKPPDLTTISKRHGGEFPAPWVYRIIDGRTEVDAHGRRDMPVWGNRYRVEALQSLPLPLDVGADALVHGRILSLVFYLDYIQED